MLIWVDGKGKNRGGTFTNQQHCNQRYPVNSSHSSKYFKHKLSSCHVNIDANFIPGKLTKNHVGLILCLALVLTLVLYIKLQSLASMCLPTICQLDHDPYVFGISVAR